MYVYIHIYVYIIIHTYALRVHLRGEREDGGVRDVQVLKPLHVEVRLSVYLSN